MLFSKLKFIFASLLVHSAILALISNASFSDKPYLSEKNTGDQILNIEFQALAPIKPKISLKKDKRAFKKPDKYSLKRVSSQDPLVANSTSAGKTLFTKPVNFLYKKPHYPSTSILRGEEGKVKVLIVINALGKVDDAKIINPSGYSRLDQSALKAAMGSIYLIKHNWGMAVSYNKEQVYVFKLSNRNFKESTKTIY